MTFEKDYHRIGCCIADVIGVVAPLSDEQRVMLVGATSPWLDQRDKRIAELEKTLGEIVRTSATIPGSVCGGALHPQVAQYLVSARAVDSARSLLGL